MSYQLITAHDSRNFTPAASVPAVFGRARTIESITIHWWGLPEWGDTFDGVVNFLCTNTKPTSAHEVIEAGKVAILVAHEDASWAAGNATGNATSIHLECRPRASDADYATVAERVRDIRAMHGKHLPLIPHRDWQATMCPGVWDLARIDAIASGAAAQGGTITPAGDLANTSIQEDELSAEFERDVRAQLASDAGKFAALDRDLRAQLQGLPSLDRDVRADLSQKGQQIAALTSTTQALAGLVGREQGLSVDDIKQAVTDAISAGLTITVKAGE